jgi:hypothetical protein
MKNIFHISIWFALSVVIFFVYAVHVIGKPEILEYSATVKPYSRVFQSRTMLRDGSRKSSPLIFFFGDSSVAQPPWAEKDSPGICSILEAELKKSRPDLKDFSLIEWSFPGSRPFHYYCMLFEAQRYSPDLLVIPINWRILGPVRYEWNRRFAFPELSATVPLNERALPSGRSVMHIEDISLKRHLSYLPLQPMLYVTGLKLWLRTFLGIDDGESSAGPAHLPAGAEEIISSISDRQLFRQYVNSLDGDNAQMDTLSALVEASSRQGINLLFYITPIHMYEMRRRPDYDPERFKESIGRVVQTVTSDHSRCLDLSGLLDKEDFIDNFEHYAPSGNRRIALAIQSAVLESIEPFCVTNSPSGSTIAAAPDR